MSGYWQDGKFILASAQQTEIERLRAELESSQGVIQSYGGAFADMKVRAEKAEAELSKYKIDAEKFSDSNLISAMVAAQERAEKAEAERDGLRAAIEKIARTPSKPFPDPSAHSWEAFGKAAHGAWRDINRTAREALAENSNEIK